MTRTNKSPILLKARALIASCIPLNHKNYFFLLFKRHGLSSSNKRQQFHLLNHYDHSHEYGFMREFEFSPSSSPLVRCRSWGRPVVHFKKKGRRLLSILLCATNVGHHHHHHHLDHHHSSHELEVVSMVGNQDEEEEEIDRRAERFIERFYEEMRIQSRRRRL